jgi:histidyl-tRNA synthetase
VRGTALVLAGWLVAAPAAAQDFPGFARETTGGASGALGERSARSTSATVSSRWRRRSIEYTDALGKFLPDQDRPNEGVFSLQDDDEQWLSLRYDLTAPLARYVAENFDALPKPYRSYRSGYVFRNEKPGPGRFRQFMQFDADTVGKLAGGGCRDLHDGGRHDGSARHRRGDYVVKVNNRKVLDGVLEAIGLGGDENAGAG